MKGIVLAGGKGTRLYPITLATCKQLLPVYDKPMIYYPISVLMLAGIRDILLITTSHDLPRFQELLKDGSHLGISISYAVQERPEGIAQAFLIAESFIQDDPVALILGDNIFYSQNLKNFLIEASQLTHGAMIFGYEVKDPSCYGVVQFDGRQVVDIIEKPKIPPSPFAVAGLYFYDAGVVEIAKHLTPSARGELEITDVNVAYLKKDQLQLKLFERGSAWLDMGTFDGLQSAASFVQAIEMRQGIKIACLEEIAYEMEFIDAKQLKVLANRLGRSEYAEYLLKVLRNSQENALLYNDSQSQRQFHPSHL